MFGWKRISLFIVSLCIAACTASSDAPEVPPTMILGSGIFTFEEGVIQCETVQVEPVKEIKCFAAMSEEDTSEVGSFDGGIVEHEWQPLKIAATNGTTLVITSHSQSTNGVSALFQIPSEYTVDEDAQGTASLKVVKSDASTRHANYSYTYMPPTPTPSSTPMYYQNPQSSPGYNNPNQ